MNLQDDTIQLPVNLVEREQRRLDQSQPDCQDYDRRFRALLDREEEPFFSLKLRYEGETLAEAVLNGTHLKGGPAVGAAPHRRPNREKMSARRRCVFCISGGRLFVIQKFRRWIREEAICACAGTG